MEEEFESDYKAKSEADAFVGHGSTLKNENLLKRNLKDLELIRMQLEHHHQFDSDSEEQFIEYLSPGSTNQKLSFPHTLDEKAVESIVGGDKGGSAIIKKSENDSEYDSAIMPRKLNLKIHTNIDENFNILKSCQSSTNRDIHPELNCSEASSMISRMQEDPNQQTQSIEKQSFQATGETWVIICDANTDSNLGQEDTMIVHKNMPSVDMLEFQESSKNTEDCVSSEKVIKVKPRQSIDNALKPEVINQPGIQANNFRRVESTSSFKRLPALGTNKSEDQHHYKQSNFTARVLGEGSKGTSHHEIEIVESHDQEQSPERAGEINQFKRKKSGMNRQR